MFRKISVAYKSCKRKVTFYPSAALCVDLMIKKCIETYMNYTF